VARQSGRFDSGRIESHSAKFFGASAWIAACANSACPQPTSLTKKNSLNAKNLIATFAKIAFPLVVVLVACTACAQSAVATAPQNVLQLSASGTVEVQQDLLSMTLVTTRDGPDAGTVQTQLKVALDTALSEARKSAVTGQLDVRTGNFSLSPRYTREGKINGWQGSTELMLEGRDFARIAQTAGRITTLTVGDIGFGLSREQRAKVETEAQAMAIANFKQQANDLAKGFGFNAYTLREVSVNVNQGGPMRSRMMTMAASSKMASDAPIPVEAGKTTVIVNISGLVQLK